MSGAENTDDKQDAEREGGRGRSTIDFPYFDQDDAISVAQAVYEIGGSECQWDQLGAKMGQEPKGGGFRMRVMAARTFGLLTYDRGTVTLTDLGIRIVDAKFVRAARVESFLAVPLFKLLYDKLKGGMLPPVAAIERNIEAAGAAPKQKDKARQVFIRSAKQAGFFEIDQNRLTYPPNITSSAQASAAGGQTETEDKSKGGGAGGGGGTGGNDLHPFIKGLLGTLPQHESDWPVAARAKWLQTAANIFDLIYKSNDEGKNIEVSVKGGTP